MNKPHQPDNSSPQKDKKHQMATSRQRSRKTQISANHSDVNAVFKRKKFKPFKVNLLDQRRVQMENNRLIKRIGQINKRKNKYNLSELYGVDDFVTLNTKARRVYRIQKQKQIQKQNDSFVQRLVNKLSAHKSVIDPQSSLNKSNHKLKHSTSESRTKMKKSDSVTLPSIYKQRITQPLK